MGRRNEPESSVEKLELRRKQANSRLDSQRERINERIDQKRAQLKGELNRKQEQIIAAALDLLAAHGLNELSLRDIAKRLDIKAPALYWYFKNKSELVDYMAEAILSREFAGAKPRTEGELWQEWLAQCMAKLRKTMLAFPDGGRVVAGAHLNPARTLAQIFEDSVLSLTSAGVDQLTALYTAMTAVHFTFGFVIEEQSNPNAEEASSSLLHEFLGAYPTLAEAFKKYSEDGKGEDQAFSIGIQLIIKGAEAR